MQTPPSTAMLRQLPLAERILLVQDIWDSIAEQSESLELTDEHKQRLDERLEAHHRDPDAGSTWEQVKARITEKP